MSLRLLVAMTLPLVAFAGCLAGIGTISAMDGLADARSAAEDLVPGNDKAEFLGVISIEPFKHFYDEEDDLEINVYMDDNPGDGKAPGWIYGFKVGDQGVAVVYSAGLGVLADLREGDAFEGFDMSEDIAISDWEIDSTEAASILRDHDGWPAPTDDTAVFWGLYQTGDGPVWEVEWSNADESHYAMVHATTGEVMATERHDYGDIFVQGGVETVDCVEMSLDDSFDGVITTLDDVQLQVELPTDGHVEFSFVSDATVGELSWELETPGGGSASGSGGGIVTSGIGSGFAGGGPGVYTLVMSSTVAADLTMEMTGYYCG